MRVFSAVLDVDSQIVFVLEATSGDSGDLSLDLVAADEAFKDLTIDAVLARTESGISLVTRCRDSHSNALVETLTTRHKDLTASCNSRL